MFNTSMTSVPFASFAPAAHVRFEPPGVPGPGGLRHSPPQSPDAARASTGGVDRSAVQRRARASGAPSALRRTALSRAARAPHDSPLRQRLAGHGEDNELGVVDWRGGLDDAVRIADMHARNVSYDAFARMAGLPREIDASPSAYLPADARADDLYTTPVPGRPLRLSARTLAQGATIKGLRARRDDRAIEYWLEVPPGKAFLSASLSGGTGAAQINIYNASGTRVPACQRLGLNTGTSKTCIVDLRALGAGAATACAAPRDDKPSAVTDDRALDVPPEGNTRFIARIQTLPKARGFRNVAFTVIAANFDGGSA